MVLRGGRQGCAASEVPPGGSFWGEAGCLPGEMAPQLQGKLENSEEVSWAGAGQVAGLLLLPLQCVHPVLSGVLAPCHSVTAICLQPHML